MDDGVTQLTEVVAARLAARGAKRDLRIYGSDDARAIAGEIDRFCREELGGAVARPLFYETQVGSVAGV
ncbi:MAG TPA: hypothetical protein VGL86_31520, partial [Polyangia bacterium]